MMMPRLYLAKNLLREDGVIFISIDDNEVHNLRLLMNEIFGEENFLASIVWQKKYAATNDSKGFSTTHDYIIAFQKTEFFSRNLLPRTEEQNQPYKNDDNDGKGLWRSDNLLVKSFSESGVYPIKNPNTGKEYYPPKGSCWRASKNTMEEWLNENRIFFGKDGKGAPQLKRYLNEVQQGRVPITWWAFDEVGHNDEANKEVSALFDSKTPFDTPKPVRLIKRLLQIGSDKDSIILDFFAGSATTAHAVMQLNKEDGGNRQFICVQMPELCDENSEAYKAGYKTIAEISKERIRRAGKKVISDEWKVISKVEQQKYGCTKLSRADCLAKSNGNDQTDLFSSQEIAQGGAICPVGSDETCSGVNSIEHSGGTSKKFDQGIYSVSGNSQRLESGSGDTATIVRESGIPCRYGYFGDNADAAGNRENVECPYAETINCPLISDKLLVDSDNHSPLTTNH